jgi:hypothetical protein
VASPSPAASATSTWLALEDGAVVRQSTSGEVVERIDSTAFGHVYVKTATQIAWDGRRNLLWYSDSHAGIRSLGGDTNENGPSLMSFSDAALVGCATVSDGRPFAIDETRRRIIVPVGTGGMLVYDADRLTLDATIPPSALEKEPGFLAPLTVDERTGAIWYAAPDGSIVELDVARLRATGRRVAFGRSPHDVRALAVRGGNLEILGIDGVVTTVNLARPEMRSTRRPFDDGLVVGLAAGG